MQIKRVKFVEALEDVAPALANHELIPSLTHFWFTDGRLMAYNDQIAISVPFDLGVKCAVPKHLLNILKLSRVKQVEPTVEGTELHLKAGRTKVKLPFLGTDSFVFTMPEPEDEQAISLPKWREAFKYCLRSVSNDSTDTNRLGITMVPGKKIDEILLYSTDGVTICRSPVPGSIIHRSVIPGSFCEQFLRLTAGCKKAWFELNEDYCLLRTDQDVVVFSRLVEVDRPHDFEDIIVHHLPKGYEKELVDKPERLKLALERAMVIVDDKVDQVRTNIKVVDGKVRMSSTSSRGDLKDTLKIDEGHPEVSLSVEPKRIRDACDDFDQILFAPSLVVAMVKDKHLFMVSGQGV